MLPAALPGEKEGTFTNTHRLVQWHDQVVEPPGDSRSELWFMAHLGRRLKELYDQQLQLDYGEPVRYYASGREYYGPELAGEEQDHFAIALASPDGDVYAVGLLLTASLLQSAQLLLLCLAALVFPVQGLLLGLLLVVAHGGLLLWLLLMLWPGLLDCSQIIALPLLIPGVEVLTGLRPS